MILNTLRGCLIYYWPSPVSAFDNHKRSLTRSADLLPSLIPSTEKKLDDQVIFFDCPWFTRTLLFSINHHTSNNTSSLLTHQRLVLRHLPPPTYAFGHLRPAPPRLRSGLLSAIGQPFRFPPSCATEQFHTCMFFIEFYFDFPLLVINCIILGFWLSIGKNKWVLSLILRSLVCLHLFHL